jgi:hypothetical protein
LPVVPIPQREPKDGVRPTFKTEVKVVYDATNIYVAVCAHDPEPARSSACARGATRDSPSDWIRVFIDSFHDGAPRSSSASIRPASSATCRGRTTQRRRRMGRGVGRVGSRDATAGAPSSAFRSRSCASSRPTTPPSASPSARRSAAQRDRHVAAAVEERERVCLVRRADHLQLTQTPKRLELVPYVVGQ